MTCDIERHIRDRESMLFSARVRQNCASSSDAELLYWGERSGFTFYTLHAFHCVPLSIGGNVRYHNPHTRGHF